MSDVISYREEFKAQSAAIVREEIIRIEKELAKVKLMIRSKFTVQQESLFNAQISALGTVLSRIEKI